MDKERWRRLERLFERAIALPVTQRDVFLHSKAGDDPSLIRQVESLILTSEEADGFFDRLDPAADLRSAVGVGDRLGPWRIEAELGYGGMGTVFRAVRDDGEFVQRVAIKMLRDQRLASPELVRRFLTERQILAHLEHPYIARLLDGGRTDQGLPWVVMEYVDGIPITAYCDRHRLSTAERLQLFCRVCEAVQFAHANLVIHRDLKPGNILVTAEGTPKLLDFGIAKLLEPDALGRSVAVTASGDRLMTPDYASPEQILGEPVTTATDVYALGLLLYELLTGRLPFERARTPAERLQRVLSGTPPRPPSTAVSRPWEEELRSPPEATPAERSGDTTEPAAAADGEVAASGGGESRGERAATDPFAARSSDPQRLRRQLRGDLDHVTLTALAREPARRYASVDLLRRDLQHHLAGLPVLARPATIGYRLGKFVRRHTEGVLIAAALLLLMVGLVAAYTWQLARERAEATREAETARQVSSFLTSIFRVADPYVSDGAELTARQLLDEGAVRLHDELRDRPAVRAEMLRVIGDVYRSLILYDRAEAALLESLELRRDPASDTAPAELARSLDSLGLLRLFQGRLEEAEAHFREALELFRADHGEAHLDIAFTLDNLGSVMFDAGRFEESARLHGEAVAMLRRVAPPESPLLAEALSNEATALTNLGRYEEAVERFREAIDRHRTWAGPQIQLARALSNVANTYYLLERHDEAQAAQREALEIRRRVLGNDHPDTVISIQSLGALLRATGELDAAQPLLVEAVETLRRTVGPETGALGAPLTNLATLLRDRGELDAAAAVFEEAIAVHRASLPPGHPDQAHPLTGLALVFDRQQRYRDALPLYQEAFELRRQGLGDDHWRTAQSLGHLGLCRLRLGETEEGLRMLEQSHRRLIELVGPDHGVTRDAARRLADAHRLLGDAEEEARYRALARDPDSPAGEEASAS